MSLDSTGNTPLFPTDADVLTRHQRRYERDGYTFPARMQAHAEAMDVLLRDLRDAATDVWDRASTGCCTGHVDRIVICPKCHALDVLEGVIARIQPLDLPEPDDVE